MNKFVKLPLFLGSVCLVFCSSLAIVVNICKPKIETNTEKKEKAAYLSLYEGITEESITNADEAICDFKDYPQIKKLVVIDHEEVSSYVYSLTSKDPQSGSVSFILGINASDNKVDAYKVVANNNSGYASQYEKENEVLNSLISYGEGGDFYQSSGATKTQKVMQDAVNQAFKHYKLVVKGGNI